MQFTTEYANLWSVLFEHVWPRDQAMPTWYPVRIHSLAASGKMGLISSESVTAMREVLIHNFVAGLSQRAAGLAQS